MLTNYLKVAVRDLLRQKAYAFISVAGLAVGLAGCLLISIFVKDELSYDRFHEKADRIFRVAVGEKQAVTPTIVAPLFRRTFPEVEQAVRLYDVGSFTPVVIRSEDAAYLEDHFVYADSTIFDVFTLPLVSGNPEVALSRPGTIVLSRTMARRYFGEDDPLGRMLIIGTDREFEITGVMEDLPQNSHLDLHLMASFSTLGWAGEEIWDTANFLTYVLLRKEEAAGALQQKTDRLLDRVRAQQPGVLSNDYRLWLLPLTSIYLRFEGRILYVYLFSAIAFLLLLVACINYVNLITARSSRRALEVGVRKTLGAKRVQLACQFYAESALATVAALGMASLITWLLLPAFNSLSGKALVFDSLMQPQLLLALMGIGLFVTTLAGFYPALVLSSFDPVSVLKGAGEKRMGGRLFRHGLVIFQFTAAIFLIAATCVVYLQLRYVKSQNLGFDREQVVVLPLPDRQLRREYQALKESLVQHPSILHASAVNSIPGYQRGGYTLIAEGFEVPEGEYFPIRGVPADQDIAETLSLEMIAGAGFPDSPAYEPDSGRYAYLVNEATLRAVGWSVEEAVGRRMGVSSGRMGSVVGVVRDYHYASLHEPVEPLALFMEEPEAYQYLMVKITPNDVGGTLRFLEQVWKTRAPHRPFHYTFLDQEFDALYRSEERTGQVFSVFAGLAVLIACFGLFGLAAYSAEQRTKEIGVRKVVGASTASIVVLLSKEYVVLVLIGIVLAAPIAYAVMDRWLADFAYRIAFSWWLFLLAGASACCIALLAVSSQSLRAALSDPVKSLRYE